MVSDQFWHVGLRVLCKNQPANYSEQYYALFNNDMLLLHNNWNHDTREIGILDIIMTHYMKLAASQNNVINWLF